MINQSEESTRLTSYLTQKKNSAIYRSEELARLDLTRIPEHIAIIPDGNRRWAKQRACRAEVGHFEGSENLITLVNAAREIGVKTLTVYSFSTENWSRPKAEVDALMAIYANYLMSQSEKMVEMGVKLETIGDLSALSPFLNKIIQDTKNATLSSNCINLVLALNYGARNEICRAFRQIIEDIEIGKIDKQAICEEKISSYLDTSPWGDPNLLIRTSGEFRVSNFLLWQLRYTEIYVSPVLWPDFTPENLLEAVISYQTREKRGGL